MGGHMYQKVGLINSWPNQGDQGGNSVTKKERDKMFSDVPSLATKRNSCLEEKIKKTPEKKVFSKKVRIHIFMEML